MLDRFMQQFSKEMELEKPVEADVPGTYVIRLDEELSIILVERDNEILLSSTLGPTPKQDEEAFLTQTLLANLFGQGTKGAVLGLNEEGTELKLTLLIDYTVEYKEFRDIMEDFINSIDIWREEMLNYK